MKQIRTNTFPHAKATLALAVCMLLACSASLRADDKDKDKDQSSRSSSSATSTESQGGPGSQSGRSSSTLNNADQKFIREAAKGGMMEVHMGKLGVQKAQDQQVKQYAQRLIDDHTKANNELKQLAASKGVMLHDESYTGTTGDTDRSNVREQTGTAHGSHADQAEHGSMKKLEQLSGTEFDREFIRIAVKDHEKDIKEFEKEAQKASDPEVKAFAQKTAPTLREHLQQAQSLQSSVGSAGSSTGHSTGNSTSTSTDNSSGIR